MSKSKTSTRHEKQNIAAGDPALFRGLTGTRLSRRRFLQASAVGAGLLGLGPLTFAADTTDWDAWWNKQKPTRELVFANWPYYIDVTEHGGKHPSLDKFTADTGISVKYLEVIQNNAPFYAKIAPVLKAGQSIGYDIIVMTSGWQVTELMMQNWLIPLWKEKIPNFYKNASQSVISPSFDKGNKYSLTWQSGFTGIAYNPKLTGRKIDSIDDLWDPDFAGHVGMMSDNTELGSIGMLKLGIDPVTSTPDDWEKAAGVLKEQKQKGLVRQYYDSSYITALENGDIWLSQAWSGDIYQAKAKGYGDLEFVVPREGGMLWHDIMMIPVGARNPLSALAWMNFYYTPEIAGMVEAYVNYICPVPAARDYIAGELNDPQVADSPLVFPTKEMYSRVHEFYTFKNYAEYQHWNSIFNPIIQG
jgi:spermidine/putrescine transport system substrate-binding protein